MARKSEEKLQIKQKIKQVESAIASIPQPSPLGGHQFYSFSQIPLLSSYHVLSSPQEMGEQAFHTIGAIHFWADLPATVVSGIHASRNKSACQYKSHVYIGHKFMPAFFLGGFALPCEFNEALPLLVFSFYIELSLETTRVYKFRERGRKI